jgi:hypothetical protein
MFKYTFQVESVSINLHYFKNFVNFAKSFFSANFVKLGKFEKKNADGKFEAFNGH